MSTYSGLTMLPNSSALTTAGAAGCCSVGVTDSADGSQPLCRVSTYDANGNTLSDPSGKSYSWDFENRLVQAIVPGTNGGTTTFRYDPFGRRIQKSGPLGTTNYLYDGTNGGNVIEEVDSTGNVLARYTHDLGIDKPFAELRSGTSSYYEQDGLGSITSLSSPAGSLANTYTYDSFGKLTASTGTLTNPFQYTGRGLDPETGIYEYRARFYDENVGRFVSEDPIRFKGGIDFYAYVKNRPTRYKDPLGLMRDCDEEHIECNRNCQKAPTSCLPWPVGRYGSPAVRRWSRTAYCTAKCLEEYMACNAANEAQQLAEYCSANPASCAAIAAGTIIIIVQPETAPIVGPALGCGCH
jgi:RHS repeat-associated protein